MLMLMLMLILMVIFLLLADADADIDDDILTFSSSTRSYTLRSVFVDFYDFAVFFILDFSLMR